MPIPSRNRLRERLAERALAGCHGHSIAGVDDGNARGDGDPLRRIQEERRLSEHLSPASLWDPEGAVAQLVKLGRGRGDRRPRLLVELGGPDADPSDIHGGFPSK